MDHYHDRHNLDEPTSSINGNHTRYKVSFALNNNLRSHMPSNHSNTDGNAADGQIINKVENVVDNVIIAEHNKTISGVTVPNNEYMNVDDLLKNEILPVKNLFATHERFQVDDGYIHNRLLLTKQLVISEQRNFYNLTFDPNKDEKQNQLSKYFFYTNETKYYWNKKRYGNKEKNENEVLLWKKCEDELNHGSVKKETKCKKFFQYFHLLENAQKNNVNPPPTPDELKTIREALNTLYDCILKSTSDIIKQYCYTSFMYVLPKYAPTIFQLENSKINANDNKNYEDLKGHVLQSGNIDTYGLLLVSIVRNVCLVLNQKKGTPLLKYCVYDYVMKGRGFTVEGNDIGTDSFFSNAVKTATLNMLKQYENYFPDICEGAKAKKNKKRLAKLKASQSSSNNDCKNNNFPTSPANESKFSCASSNQSFHPKGKESNSYGCISYNSMNTSHMQVTNNESGQSNTDS